jgi:hypothetical protein
MVTEMPRRLVRKFVNWCLNMNVTPEAAVHPTERDYRL